MITTVMTTIEESSDSNVVREEARDMNKVVDFLDDLNWLENFDDDGQEELISELEEQNITEQTTKSIQILDSPEILLIRQSESQLPKSAEDNNFSPNMTILNQKQNSNKSVSSIPIPLESELQTETSSKILQQNSENPKGQSEKIRITSKNNNEEQTNKEETDISEILRNLNLEMQLVGNTSNNETSDSVNRNFNENSDDSNSTFLENRNQISQNFTDNSNNKNNNAEENFMSSSVRKVLNSTTTTTEISENQKLTKIKESNNEQNKNNTNIKKNNQETSETIITSSVTNSAMSNKIDNIIIDKNAGLEFNFNVPSALPTKEGWQGNDNFVKDEKKIDGMADKIVEVFGPGIDLVSDELFLGWNFIL